MRYLPSRNERSLLRYQKEKKTRREARSGTLALVRALELNSYSYDSECDDEEDGARRTPNTLPCLGTPSDVSLCASFISVLAALTLTNVADAENNYSDSDEGNEGCDL